MIFLTEPMFVNPGFKIYLLELYFENSAHNGHGNFRFRKKRNSRTIAKWTFFQNDPAGRELLTLTAIGLGGEKYLNALPLSKSVAVNPHRPLRVVHVLARHYPLDIQSRETMLGSGVDVDAAGHVVSLRAKDLSVLVPSHIPARKLNIGAKSSAYLLLAYGGGYRPGPRGEDFEFTDPLFRRTRFHSLLLENAPLTHPVDFINRLRYKGIRWGRIPSRNVLRALCAQLSKQLDIPTDSWLDVDADMGDAWNTLQPWQQRAVLPILDMARHMMDAFPRSATPLEMPGVVLMDQPEIFCPSAHFMDYLMLLDKLFPRLQFVLSAGAGAMERFPPTFRQQRLPIPYNGIPQTKPRPVRLPRDTILLIDVDGRLPNLALMKLYTHHRQMGRTVQLEKRDCFLKGPDRVYASTVFYSPLSQRRNRRLRQHYGDKLILGGTGEDITSRLPDSVEALCPDYTLYPELGDRGIGFITRGKIGVRVKLNFLFSPP